MKKTLLLTIAVLLTFFIGFAQNSIQIPISSINSTLIVNDINSYVESNMAQWKIKGKFETTTDYANRQSPEVLAMKSEEFKHIKVNEIAAKVIKLAFSDAVYNADSQAFKMTLVGLPSLNVHVPSENGEAFIFEKNFDKILFRSPVYGLNNSGFYVTNVEVVNNYNQKVYEYPYVEPEVIETPEVVIEEPIAEKVEETTISQPETVVVETVPTEIIELEVEAVEPVEEPKPDNYIELPKVGVDLPVSTTSNPDAVAVIIGNSEYKHTSNVKYAVNDAELMKQYLVSVLGYKEGNVFFEKNVTKGTFENYFGTKDNPNGKLAAFVKQEKSDVFIYYAGHGFPDRDGNVYFLPQDAEPNIVQLGGYPMSTFYNNISKLNAKSVTIILDACFSGFGIQRSVSGVRIVEDVKEEIPNGSILTSSAASEESTWLDQENHGMFTYFFMRALHDKEIADTNQDRQLTIGEIFDYVSNNSEGVPYYARRLHQLEQHPEFKGDREKVMMVY